jgi:RHS repeat-associated protein
MAPDGTVRSNNRVFPFGEQWQLPTGSSNTQEFTTYQRDGESGLDYAMARYYASRSGRFMTPDPGHIGAFPENPQSWNAYAYVGNDPVNRKDSTGLAWELCFDGAFENYCVLLDTKHEYLGWVADLGQQGYRLPTSASFFSERVCASGEGCLTVRFVESGEIFLRELAPRAAAIKPVVEAMGAGMLAMGGGLAAGSMTTGTLLTIGRIAPPVVYWWSKLDNRTLVKFVQSLQSQAATNTNRLAGRLSVQETRALLEHMKQNGWKVYRGVETGWRGGAHINVIAPGGGQNLHLPVPPGFQP